MAEVVRRHAWAVTAVLMLAALGLASLLAFNLRNLDPGTEQLPPAPPESPPPANCLTSSEPNCNVPEGIGAPLRALFLTGLLTTVVLTVAGTIVLWRRGVKLRTLLSGWEILAYALTITFIVVVFLFYGAVRDGLAALIAWGTGSGGGASGGEGTGAATPQATTASTLVLIVAGAIVGVYLIVFSAAFFPKLYGVLTTETPNVGRSKGELARAVRTAIADLESGGDFRTAVLRCYRSMVLLFETRGLRSNPSQTAREYEADALHAIGVSREGIDDLTSLFEEARYSHHTIGEAQRDAALGSLREIRTQLEAPS